MRQTGKYSRFDFKSVGRKARIKSDARVKIITEYPADSEDVLLLIDVYFETFIS